MRTNHVGHGTAGSARLDALRRLGLSALLVVLVGATVPLVGTSMASAAAGDAIGVVITGPSEVPAGDTATYTATITNLDEVTATGVVLDISRSSFGQVTLVDQGTLTCEGFGYLSCELASLAPGATATVELSMTPDAFDQSPIRLWAWVSSNLGSAQDELAVAITGAVDLVVAAERPTVALGEPYAVDLVVTEQGTDGLPAAGPVTVDVLPSFFVGGISTDGGVTIAAGTGWTCDGPSCTHPGPVPAGGTLPPITASGTFTDEGTIITYLEATADDVPGNNQLNVPVRPVDPDLAVSLFGAPATAGQPLTINGTVLNQGDTAFAGPAEIELTTTMVAPTASGPGWTCSAFVGGTATCTAGLALDSFESTAFSIAGTAPTDAPNVTTTADVSPGGWRTTNDFTSTVTTVTGGAAFDLSIAVDGPAEVSSGGPVELTAVVANPSAFSAPGPITVDVSGDLFDVSGSGPGWSCEPLFGSTVCTHGGPVGAGGVLPTLTLAGSAPIEAESVEAFVSVDPRGSNTANDVDSWSAVLTTPDLAVSLTDDGATFVEGDTGTYRVTVDNVGDGTAFEPVRVFVNTPFIDTVATGDGWTCSGSTWADCSHDGPVAAGGSLPELEVTGTVVDAYQPEVEASARVTLGFFGDVDDSNDLAEVSTPVTPLVDLALTATIGGPLVVGETGTIRLTLANLGAGTASTPIELYIWDSPFGADQSVAAAGWSCDLEGTETCTYIGDLGPGEVLPDLVWSGTVAPISEGVARYDAYVFHPDDRRYENDSATGEVPATAPVDLSAEIEGPAELVAGQDATFTLRAVNLGTAPTDGEISMSAWIPFGVDLVSFAGDGWDCSFGWCTTSTPIPGGGAAPDLTLVVTPRSSHDDEVTVSAVVDGGGDQNGANEQADLTLPFVATADAQLELDDADADAVFVVGGPVAYTATATNPGTDPVAGPVSVEVQVSFDVTGTVGDGGETWTCETPWEGTVQCQHPGPIPAGGSLPAITITGTLGNTFGSSILAQGSIYADGDQLTGNNFVEIDTLVGGESDLTVALSSGPATHGQPVAIEAVVTNVLETEAVGSITVELSGNPLQSPAASGDGWTCEEADGGGNVECTRPGPVPGEGSLPPVVLTGTVGTTFGGSFFAFAEVRGQTDGNRTNDFDSLSVEVILPVDLTVAISDDDVDFLAGGTGTSTVVVTNLGTSATTEPITVEVDTNPDTARTGSGDGWTCGDVDDLLICEHAGPVASGESLPELGLSIPVPVGSSSIRSAATVASTEDGRTNNNHDFDFSTIVSVTDLTLSITDGEQAFSAGTTGTYEIEVANDGTADSAGEITVTLDATGPITPTDLAGDGWTCDLPTLTCTTSAVAAAGGTLPALTASMSVAVGAGSTASISGEVAGGGDGNTGNNFASDSTPIVAPDLVVAVSDADATFTAPGTGSYEVVAGNRGGAPTVGTTTVTFVPAGPLSVASAAGDGWTCPTDGDSCTTDAVIGVGADFPPIMVTVDVAATEERSGSLTATASGLDANLLNSADTETTPIVVPADLTLSLVPEGTWFVGRPSDLTATVSNVGTGPASGPVTVTFPRAYSATGTGWTCAVDDGTTTCVHAGPVAVGDDLPAITATETPLLVHLPEVTRTATVDDPSDGSPGNNAASVDIAVELAVDLTVELAYDQPFTVGQADSVDITVSNLGIEPADGPIVLTVNLREAGFPAFTGDGWDCLTLFGTTSCVHDGPLAPGADLPVLTAAFAVTIADHPATSVSASVSQSDDVRADNDVASASIPTLGVDLVMDVTDLADGAAAEIGDTRLFRIDVENIGGLAPPGAATVTVRPGPGVLQSTFASSGWSCSPGDGTTFTCSTTEPVPALGTYPPLNMESYIGGDGFPDTHVEATVVVPGESVADLANTDRIGFEVLGAPDLKVSVDAPLTASVGDRLEVVATVANDGQVAAGGTTTVDLYLPAGAGAPAGSGTGWTCALVDGDTVLQCQTTEVSEPGIDLPALTLGFDVLLAAYPSAGLDLVVDNPNDGDTRNNTAAARVVVIGIPDLVPELDDAPLIAGQVNQVPLVIENQGTEPAEAVTTVTTDEDTHEGLTTVAASGDGWTCAVVGGAATCTHPGPVPAEGALPTLTLDVLADAELYDAGRPCQPVEFGDRLLRGCADVGEDDEVLLGYEVTNADHPLADVISANAAVVVRQPIDLQPYTIVTEDHPGAVAELTTTVQNLGVDPATGTVRVVQRLECGLLADLSPGPQGSCLPGTDLLAGLTALDVAGAGWTCDLLDGV
ncbi:MAG: hypothetical protein ACSLFP_10170, partial [Acidimicrobiales bacterium]